MVYAFDELLDHLLGDDEVGDHAIFHRPDRSDVAGSAAEHLFRREADLLDHFFAVRSAFLADRDDGGFIQHDAFATHVNQRVCRAQVDGEIVVKVAAQKTEH